MNIKYWERWCATDASSSTPNPFQNDRKGVLHFWIPTAWIRIWFVYVNITDTKILSAADEDLHSWSGNKYQCINLVHHSIHINVSRARIQLVLSRHQIICYHKYVYTCTTFKHQLYPSLRNALYLWIICFLYTWSSSTYYSEFVLYNCFITRLIL